MKVAVVTLGCKVNQYESEALAKELGADFELVRFAAQADCYVINSCAVTNEAEHKSRQLIYRARRSNSSALVIATGCYSDLDGQGLAGIGTDMVVSNSAKPQLGQLIRERLGVTGASSTATKEPPPGSRTRAYVKVQDGCDQYCSYCVVPYARPNLKSKLPGEILAEIQDLAGQGVAEVILTGIHLGKYGVGTAYGSLDKLVASILAETDLPRLRLSSIEPGEVSPELIDLMRATARITRHLHIPLQSGSDRILKEMNRPYSTEDYLQLATKIKQDVPGTALTTDVMAGFPGETEEDFEATCDLIKQIGFSRLHVFPYSPRPMTPAASMPQTDKKVTARRAARLRAIGHRLAGNYAAGLVGKKLSVVVEKADGNVQEGTAGEYVRVRFTHQRPLIGSMVKVKIDRAQGSILKGTICLKVAFFAG